MSGALEAPFFFVRSNDPFGSCTIVQWDPKRQACSCLINGCAEMNFNPVSCLLCFVMLTQGCAIQSRLAHSDTIKSDAQIPDGRLDFAWKLSGDRTVAPLQVFSDNSRTWLHWHPNQSVPAILASQDGQEQVLTYKRQDPYTIIEGHWSRLSFRAGRQQAQARRVRSLQEPPPAPAQSLRSEPVVQSSVTHTTARDSSVTSVQAPSLAFAVTPEDQNLRQALIRWTGISGWRFQPEHWVVDVDIPLSAGASFSDDFISSVQALLLSTELSDRPLQPCFYTNQVLRVVPSSEPCDRTILPGAPV